MPRPYWKTKFALSACLIVLLTKLSARAQGQGSTNLDVTMQLTSSISLVFDTYPGGCALANSGTNSVGLNLGWADNFPPGYSGCGSYSGGNGTTYTVSTPFYLDVEVQNSTSTQYALRVWMSAPNPIPGKVSFLLNGAALTNTRPATAQQTNSYGKIMETFGISVQKQVTSQVLDFTAQFEATAQ
jgi:hypothetical protein